MQNLWIFSYLLLLIMFKFIVRCDICNKWVKNLKLHVIKSHSNQENDTPEDFQCDVCKKVFTNKKSMRLHLKRHAKMNTPVEDQYHKFMVENFDLKCEQCEYIFSTFRDAKNHYKEKHNEINGYLKCCSIKLKKNVFVRDHIKSHLNPDIFKCVHSYNSYVRKSSCCIYFSDVIYAQKHSQPNCDWVSTSFDIAKQWTRSIFAIFVAKRAETRRHAKIIYLQTMWHPNRNMNANFVTKSKFSFAV